MYDKDDKNNELDSSEYAEINKNFGKYINALREEARLSQAALAEEPILTHQSVNKIINGKLRATPDKIKILATKLKIHEESLRVIAGRPSLRFIQSFQKSPDEVIHKIMAKIELYKIGIAEVLLGAHVFWAPSILLEPESVCKFEVQTYETGREALKELIDGRVQFATVTEAVLEFAAIKEDEYVKILFFTVPQQVDFYSVYAIPSKKRRIKLAYLKGTASQRAASKFKTSKYQIEKTAKDSVKQIAEAISKSEIDGFFGWSPLHHKVNYELKKLGKAGKQVIKRPELKLASSFDQRLYLVAKQEYLKKHPLVLRELIQAIILAREQLNHILEKSPKIEKIKRVLVEKMPYLKDLDIEDEVRNLRFDSNIKSDAFKYLFAP